MSPTLLATLRRIEADTRRLATRRRPDCPDLARYPRDYYRASELLTLWRGAGRFYGHPLDYTSGS